MHPDELAAAEAADRVEQLHAEGQARRAAEEAQERQRQAVADCQQRIADLRKGEKMRAAYIAAVDAFATYVGEVLDRNDAIRSDLQTAESLGVAVAPALRPIPADYASALAVGKALDRHRRRLSGAESHYWRMALGDGHAAERRARGALTMEGR
ncbi:MAG TPA: hypothetical protein VM324_08575 [Egibacteraceae bacterium]|nr:hypothetical protein [Egibacteraceae bacterium]